MPNNRELSKQIYGGFNTAPADMQKSFIDRNASTLRFAKNNLSPDEYANFKNSLFQYNIWSIDNPDLAAKGIRPSTNELSDYFADKYDEADFFLNKVAKDENDTNPDKISLDKINSEYYSLDTEGKKKYRDTVKSKSDIDKEADDLSTDDWLDLLPGYVSKRKQERIDDALTRKDGEDFTDYATRAVMTPIHEGAAVLGRVFTDIINPTFEFAADNMPVVSPLINISKELAGIKDNDTETGPSRHDRYVNKVKEQQEADIKDIRMKSVDRILSSEEALAMKQSIDDSINKRLAEDKEGTEEAIDLSFFDLAKENRILQGASQNGAYSRFAFETEESLKALKNAGKISSEEYDDAVELVNRQEGAFRDLMADPDFKRDYIKEEGTLGALLRSGKITQADYMDKLEQFVTKAIASKEDGWARTGHNIKSLGTTAATHALHYVAPLINAYDAIASDGSVWMDGFGNVHKDSNVVDGKYAYTCNGKPFDYNAYKNLLIEGRDGNYVYMKADGSWGVGNAEDMEAHPDRYFKVDTIDVSSKYLGGADLNRLGLNDDGSEVNPWFNQRYLQLAEQYNIMPTNTEALRYADKYGYSPYLNKKVDEDNRDLVAETVKMMGFALPDMAAAFLFRGAGSGVGRLFGRSAAAIGSNVGSVLGASLGASAIADSYAQSSFEENNQRNRELIEERMYKDAEKEVSDYIASNKDLVDKRVAELKSAYTEEQLSQMPEEQIVEIATQDIKNRLIEDKLREYGNTGKYTDLYAESIDAAGTAALVDYWTEGIKYGIVNSVGYKSWMFKPRLTMQEMAKSSNLGKMLGELRNGVRDRVESVKVGNVTKQTLKNDWNKLKFKDKIPTYLKVAGEQFWGGAWTNWTDDMQSGGARALNNMYFDEVLEGENNGAVLYSNAIAADLAAIKDSIFKSTKAFLQGSAETAQDENAIWAGIVGGVGGLVGGVNPMAIFNARTFLTEKGRKEFSELSAEEKINLFLSNGVISEVAERAANDRAAQELLDRGNKIRETLAKSAPTAVALMQTMNQTGKESTTSEEVENSLAGFMHIYNMISSLKEEVGNESWIDPDHIMQDMLNDVTKLASLDENPEAKEAYIGFLRVHKEDLSVAQATEEIANVISRAKTFLNYQKQLDELYESRSYKMASDAAKVAMVADKYSNMLAEALVNDFDKVESQLGNPSTKEVPSSKSTTAPKGLTQKGIDVRKKATDELISINARRIKEIDSELSKLRSRAVTRRMEILAEKLNTETDEDKRAQYEKEIREHDYKVASLTRQREALSRVNDTIAKDSSLFQETQTSVAEGVADVLSADEILRLPAMDRVQYFNSAREEFTEEQNEQIDKARRIIEEKTGADADWVMTNQAVTASKIAANEQQSQQLQQDLKSGNVMPVNPVPVIEKHKKAADEHFTKQARKYFLGSLEKIQKDKTKNKKSLYKELFSKYDNSFLNKVIPYIKSKILRDAIRNYIELNTAYNVAVDALNKVGKRDPNIDSLKDNLIRIFKESDNIEDFLKGLISRASETDASANTVQDVVKRVTRHLISSKASVSTDVLDSAKSLRKNRKRKADAVLEDIRREAEEKEEPVKIAPKAETKPEPEPKPVQEEKGSTEINEPVPAESPAIVSQEGVSKEGEDTGASASDDLVDNTKKDEAIEPTVTETEELPLGDVSENDIPESNTEKTAEELIAEQPTLDDEYKDLAQGTTDSAIAEDESLIRAYNEENEEQIEASNNSKELVKGNAMSMYDLLAAKIGRLRNKIFGTSMQDYYTWMSNRKIEVQKIIDEKLGDILATGTEDNPVKVRVARINNKLGGDCAGMGGHTLLVVELDDAIRKVYKESDYERYGKPIKSNGKEYIVIGTLGFAKDNTEQRNNYNNINRVINYGATPYFRANPTEEIYVDEVLYTHVARQNQGDIITVLKNEDKEVFRSLGELMADPERNPNGYKSYADFTFGVQLTKGFAILGDDTNHAHIIRQEKNTGNIFVYVKAPNGRQIPLMIRPASYRNLIAGSEFKTRIDNDLKGLASLDVDVRKYAIADLLQCVVLSEDGLNIRVGNSEDTTIGFFNGDTLIGSVINVNSPTAYSEIMAMFMSLNPRINITRKSLENPDSVRILDEAGALMTDSSVLGLMNSDFSVYNIDTNTGKPIIAKQDTEPKPLTVREKDHRELPYNGSIYHYDPESKVFSDENGNAVPSDTPEYYQLSINKSLYDMNIQPSFVNQSTNMEYFIYKSVEGNTVVLGRNMSTKQCWDVTNSQEGQYMLNTVATQQAQNNYKAEQASRNDYAKEALDNEGRWEKVDATFLEDDSDVIWEDTDTKGALADLVEDKEDKGTAIDTDSLFGEDDSTKPKSTSVDTTDSNKHIQEGEGHSLGEFLSNPDISGDLLIKLVDKYGEDVIGDFDSIEDYVEFFNNMGIPTTGITNIDAWFNSLDC